MDDSFSRTLRWVHDLDPHDFDMADETRGDGFVEGLNTPYAPLDETPTHGHMDPVDDLEVPYSPAYQSHFRNSAGVDGFVEGYNTPYAPVDEAVPRFLDSAEMDGGNTPYSPVDEASDDMARDTGGDDLETPYSPPYQSAENTVPRFRNLAGVDGFVEGYNTPYARVDEAPTHGQIDPATNDLPVDEAADARGGWTWNDFNDLVPAYMYGRTAAATDPSTPRSPLAESPDNSGGWTGIHHTNHFNTRLDAYGLGAAPVNAIIEREDTPYSPNYPLLDSNVATRGQRATLIHGLNTPYSPIAEFPESGAHSSNPIIIDDTMSDMEARGQTYTAFDGMNTPYAPQTDSTDITFGRDAPIFSGANFHMAAPDQKSASVDELVTRFSPRVDYGFQHGYNPRPHNGTPVYTRKLDSPLPEAPNTSGSGTQCDPFVIDDETADRIVGEALRLHRARNERAVERSNDIVPTYMGSPTPRLSPTAHARDTVPDDVRPSFQPRSNLAQELHDLDDTDYSSPSRPVKRSSGKAAVRHATSNIDNMPAASIHQPRRSPFDMPQNIRDLYDFAFEVAALGPSAAPKTSSRITFQRAPSYVNKMVAEEIRQPRQYLFVELPQEIEDMIFDFAFPGSDEEYIRIRSEADWESTALDTLMGRVSKPYPGHKVNEFLGVSKQFFHAASQAYLRNQGFNLRDVTDIFASAARNAHVEPSPLLQGCTKLASQWTTLLNPRYASELFPSFKRLEFRPAPWSVGGPENIMTEILDENELRQLENYKDLCDLRGLVEFRIEPRHQRFSVLMDDYDEETDAFWLANMVNLEALLKPLVTQPKPRSIPTSPEPIEEDPDQNLIDELFGPDEEGEDQGFVQDQNLMNELFGPDEEDQDQRSVHTPSSPVEEDPDQELIDAIQSESKLGPVDEEDRFHEGHLYGSDEAIIRSFVKDPSGFIAWAREMRNMKDRMN